MSIYNYLLYIVLCFCNTYLIKRNLLNSEVELIKHYKKKQFDTTRAKWYYFNFIVSCRIFTNINCNIRNKSNVYTNVCTNSVMRYGNHYYNSGRTGFKKQ